MHNLEALRAPFPIDGELQDAVRRLLHNDSAFAPHSFWIEAMEHTGRSLNGQPQAIAPFVEAWRALYTVTLLLDHLQDGDALGDSWLEALVPAVQYHLAFCVYIAAQHALAALDSALLPQSRIQRLQQFWNASVVQLAQGQFVDLTLTSAALQGAGARPLDVYEQLAAQKTGASFALALGGLALLVTEDDAVIEALITAGSVYGMLLQYRDDLLDSAHQEGQPEAATLSRALLAAHPELTAYSTAATNAFWASVYTSYLDELETVLLPLPPQTRAVYVDLLRRSFGDPAELSGMFGAVREDEAPGR